MSDDQAGNEQEQAPGKRGQAKWQEEKDRVAERNRLASKDGQQRREAYERQKAEARRSAERRRMAELLSRRAAR
jgi:hypothetical protein